MGEGTNIDDIDLFLSKKSDENDGDQEEEGDLSSDPEDSQSNRKANKQYIASQNDLGKEEFFKLVFLSAMMNVPQFMLEYLSRLSPD